ncbi:oligoendopeptidase F [Paenibacillus thiaminolyticus]|uniref:Oligopeptidase F n=1 Tax=Paenibacillus thiaminolyticus TaxID=49283 RepID=A0AAP9DZA5_PANTH|nr:oligoendopeptidase F [Paenibacillus thiaminolyticus]MCY9533451.1 oligoendopeptidase F [Paenibacillus thiaminolyticus]MCY9604116.1 oligoendopeptidase F [Paenibacillus thiaminolyticus]MCY9606336.1 oligoendopeptidase F [Paenibacillus thiaminolyticus]MCY9612086.1 oligoendopeptidase F [Paenibacillus thiaminolyticus]MCY9618107.1 oligoendopeptidase F [Paenibacillus thiaminolyticus]
MQQLMKRSEVPQEHRWKLQDLFGSRAEWDKEYELVLQLVEKMKQYHGKLNEAAALKACFELEDDISLHTERLYVYANMSHHEDTADPVYQALSEKAKQLSVKVSEALSFITPEVLSLSDEELDRLIADPSLSAYRFTLVEMKRQKAHVLSKGEEALLAQVGNMSKAPETIYSMLNNADMKFPKIKNEKGEEVELTHGRYVQFLESRNSDVRRAAFEGVYSTYRKQRNTIAATLSANVTKNLFYARARKYPSALEMYLFGDNIPKEVYTNLINTIHKHLPLMHRYMKLRKQLLQVDELHMYDLFAPVVEEFDMDITFDEAKKIVKESLKPLGENYLAALQEGFDSSWIDVYENEGKRTGAYSWGAYGTHPYVLLNHKDNLNSMFTLTHEMGHALHSYYSDNNLPYRDAQYTIFLAEVASTLNEALLMDYMLKKTNDKKEKMYLLAYYIDQFRTTVFRQTMFAEFELLIHEHAEKGEALTPQLLCEIYYDLNKKYYGDDMVVDQDIEMEWARIPHFYTSFYVYKYATGFSAAQSFAKQILDEGQPAVDRYLGFLKSGGSDYSINILQKAGVDMSAPTPIEEGMSLLESLIEEMEKMAAEK